MSISVGSSSNTLSSLQSLLQSIANSAGNVAGVGSIGDMAEQLTSGLTSPATGGAQAPPFGPSPPPFSSGMMAALMALQGQGTSGTNGSGGPQSLFSQLDTDGDGSISKSEFESALSQSGVDTQSADALFGKLDQNGDGSVSQSELSSAAHHGHHHMRADGDGDDGQGQGQGLSSLLNATGAQTQTATNSDGSSTTTITYADGSTVTMTTPASQQGDTSGGNTGGQTTGGAGSNNLLEQLIRLQAQLVSQQGASVSAVA